MSLLRRIESARPAADMTGSTGVPQIPGPPPIDPPGSRVPVVRANPSVIGSSNVPQTVPPPPTTTPGGGGGGAGLGSGRMLAQVPLRESFRDAKFRIQQRVISDLDPKLDLSNQVEVRREIEEAFGRALDAEGLALTRAERTRMLEQITDEIVGLGPLEPLAARRGHHRGDGQRPAPGLHRALGQDRADQRQLPER